MMVNEAKNSFKNNYQLMVEWSNDKDVEQEHDKEIKQAIKAYS